jgi:transposase
MNQREHAGLTIAATKNVTCKDGAWGVPSDNGNGRYRVILGEKDGGTCNCEDHQTNGVTCKHIYAALFVRKRSAGGDMPDPATACPPPPPPSYPQDWPKYNQSQHTELPSCLEMAAELVRGLQDPPPDKRIGRRRTPYRDQVLVAFLKVFEKFSCRRFGADRLGDFVTRGWLAKDRNRMSVCAYLQDPRLTPLLEGLIAESSTPLKELETVFAADSTGFSSVRYYEWLQEKKGKLRQGRTWTKAHVMVGVRSNIITAAYIGDRDEADSPQLPSLLKTTARTFNVREVVADKGYLSHENMDVVDGHGATPYIPFKNNSIAGEEGTVWNRMFHQFSTNRPSFLEHYHKRSNVETTFHMVKAKFGHAVLSRTPTAMRNEVLVKFLCHNLAVLHRMTVTLGLGPVVLGKDVELEGGDAGAGGAEMHVLPLKLPG